MCKDSAGNFHISLWKKKPYHIGTRISKGIRGISTISNSKIGKSSTVHLYITHKYGTPHPYLFHIQGTKIKLVCFKGHLIVMDQVSETPL